MGKRKFVATISILALIISMFCFTPDVDAGIQKLNLSKQTKEIKVGESFQLSLNGVKVSSIKWKSSKSKVASVSKKGVVKGLKAGTTTITGKYKSLKFTVTVNVVAKSKDQEQTDPTPDETAQYPTYNDLILSDESVELYYIGMSKYDESNIKINFKAVNKLDKIAYWGFDVAYVDDAKIYDLSSDKAMTGMNSYFYVIVPKSPLPKELKAILYAHYGNCYYEREFSYKFKY